MERGDPGWDDTVTLARRRITALARVCVRGYVEQWFATRALGPALDGVIRHARGYKDGVKRLMVEMPQQEGKTLHTCLMAASLLGQAPELRVIDSGYSDEFIKVPTEHIGMIGGSDGWADVYPDVSLGIPAPWRRGGLSVPKKAADTAHMIDVLVRTGRGWKRSGGYFLARGIKGAVGGRSADVTILEDPYKGWDGEMGALSPGWNKTLENFYRSILKTRQQGERSCEVVAFTPFTDSDIRQPILDMWDKAGVPYLHIKLPSRQRPGSGDYEHERKRVLSCEPALRGLAKFVGVHPDALRAAIAAGGRCRPYDPRAEGEGLGVLRHGQGWYDDMLASMTPLDYAALCDMAPRSDLVDRFPAARFGLWDPVALPPSQMDRVVLICDANGDETEAGAFCSIGVWGVRRRTDPGPGKYPYQLYRMWQWRGRPGYADFCDAVELALKTWPEIQIAYFERAGHARSLRTDSVFRSREHVRRRRLEFPPAEGTWTNPTTGKVEKIGGSKDERWKAIEHAHAQGCIYVPMGPSTCGRVTAEWVTDRRDVGAADAQDGSSWGYVTEMARAGRVKICDRVDETALLCLVLTESAPEDRQSEILRRMPVPAGWR